MSHTPGPWTYHPTAGDHDFSVYAEDGGRGDVALVRDFNEANARLIAAAPELAESLRLLCGYIENLPRPYDDCRNVEAARALLARLS